MPRNKIQTEQIRAESREKILATAQRLFAEQGYEGTNVSDIAREAGMSQGNIYWYFPSKKDIFKAILEEGFTNLGTVLAEAATYAGTAEAKFDHFLDHFFSVMREKGGQEFISIIVTLIAQGGVQRFADFGLSTAQIGAGYHQSLNAIFSAGQEEGIFPAEIDPNLLSTFFFSFSNGLMLMYPDEWKQIPQDYLRQAIVRMLGMKAG